MREFFDVLNAYPGTAGLLALFIFIIVSKLSALGKKR